MQSADLERAEFEALLYKHPYLRELGTLKNPNGDYCDLDIQDCWEFYQAGRAALQSQDRGNAYIPEERIDYTPSITDCDAVIAHREGYTEGWNDCRQDVIDHARRVEENE